MVFHWEVSTHALKYIRLKWDWLWLDLLQGLPSVLKTGVLRVHVSYVLRIRSEVSPCVPGTHTPTLASKM